MNHDAIQTQRETWLRARIARTERERERDEGIARLDEIVARACAREAEEEQALDALIAGAKASFDGFKELPQTLAAPEEAAVVAAGGVFGAAGADEEAKTRRLGPPMPRGDTAFSNSSFAEPTS